MKATYLPEKEISLIQAPLSLGQSLAGVHEAPKALIQHGLQTQVESLGWKITDTQTLDVNNQVSKIPLPAHQQGIRIKFPNELGKACQDLSQMTAQTAAQKKFALTLGGDHSIAIGSIGGMLSQWKDLGVIWVDAHGDFNTPQTSPSGNIHGMPLAFLTGQMKKYPLKSFEWLKTFVPIDRLVLIGIRSIDDEERVLMKSVGVNVFSMTEIDRWGIGGVMERAFEILFKNGKIPLHLSYDIDAVDPHYAPSTGTRVRGGLNYREAHYIAEACAESRSLVGMDLVEINPQLESNSLTVEVGLELIGSALGKRIY